jgi:hypothetical protein
LATAEDNFADMQEVDVAEDMLREAAVKEVVSKNQPDVQDSSDIVYRRRLPAKSGSFHESDSADDVECNTFSVLLVLQQEKISLLNHDRCKRSKEG